MPAQSAKQLATDRTDPGPGISIERALPADLEALLAIETACFSSDRLSRRSFKR